MQQDKQSGGFDGFAAQARNPVPYGTWRESERDKAKRVADWPKRWPVGSSPMNTRDHNAAKKRRASRRAAQVTAQ